MEKLASKIMAQMARRDIWVVDVDVFEFAKKRVNFKETKGGILLKNKKFLLDNATFEENQVVSVADQSQSDPNLNWAVDEDRKLQPHELMAYGKPQKPMTQQSGTQQPTPPRANDRPVDFVMFVPEPQHMPEIREKNLQFKIDNKYPVFEKKPHPLGVGHIYRMRDDVGREHMVSDKYFAPITKLSGGFENSSNEEVDLWGNSPEAEKMVDIRRR